MCFTYLLYLGDCYVAKNPAIYDRNYDYNEGICDKLMRHYDDMIDVDDIQQAQVNGISIATASTIIMMILP